MTCPNCNAKLEVINNNYYCPICKIYIGAVRNPLPVSSKGAATSRWQLQNQVQINNPVEEQRTEEFDLKKTRFNLKEYLVPIVTLVCIAIIYLVVTNIFNYLSFSPYCNIDIKEKKEGFRRDVIKELDLIKQQDQAEYKNICKYVSTIVQHPCPLSDEGNTGETNMRFGDHCFVKGSNVIYLDNVEKLKQTAKLSQEYWIGQ